MDAVKFVNLGDFATVQPAYAAQLLLATEGHLASVLQHLDVVAVSLGKKPWANTYRQSARHLFSVMYSAVATNEMGSVQVLVAALEQHEPKLCGEVDFLLQKWIPGSSVAKNPYHRDEDAYGKCLDSNPSVIVQLQRTLNTVIADRRYASTTLYQALTLTFYNTQNFRNAESATALISMISRDSDSSPYKQIPRLITALARFGFTAMAQTLLHTLSKPSFDVYVKYAVNVDFLKDVVQPFLKEATFVSLPPVEQTQVPGATSAASPYATLPPPRDPTWSNRAPPSEHYIKFDAPPRCSSAPSQAPAAAASPLIRLYDFATVHPEQAAQLLVATQNHLRHVTP
jgi:hypothetical protein